MHYDPLCAADGSLGDMLFFHTYKNPGLVLDIVQVGAAAFWAAAAWAAPWLAVLPVLRSQPAVVGLAAVGT